MLTPPFIQNISRAAVRKGHHFDPGPNAMLIQISDPPGDHPEPLYKFREVHQFDFLDIEKDNDPELGEFAITQEQADKLSALLQHAFTDRMNVIVHCHAGICRSGAVVEVGVMLGFRDPEVFRSPNLLVKHKMMKALGWSYDENEPHTINGAPVEEDWTNDNEKVFTLADARRKFRENYEGDV